MKLFIKTSVLMFLFIFVSSCEKEIITRETFTLNFGSECGWCAGQEYITITKSKIEYVRNIPCGDEKGTINKSREINADEWNTITDSFDYALFKTLDYNNCNVCADGCDEIIEITKENSVHELRYSISEDIEGMENLQQKLVELMEEMRQKN